MEKMTEEKAARLMLERGFNCAQATLGHFAEELGLDVKTAMKLASGFGGGMRLGDECGCATGALMALGLKYGFTEPGDGAGKSRINQTALKFLERFRERFGSVYCRDLLEADLSTEEGRARAAEAIPKRCPVLAAGACQILEDMLRA